jgi:DNA ligase (NAD+)
MGRGGHKERAMATFLPLEKLSTAEARKEANRLRETIEYHNQLYYVKNQPEISDALYDKLFRRLEQLEAKFPELRRESSPTQRVGAKPQADRQVVEHAAPMLSIHAAADEDEVARFHEFARRNSDNGKVNYFLEPKFDGASVELVYEHGRFQRASTRGDGQKGDDISVNLALNEDFIRELRGAKKSPEFLSLRGEAYLSKHAFQEINKRRLIDNLEPFANPRNAAAGMLHRLQPEASGAWPIEVIVYDILRCVGTELETQHEVWKQIKRWGFKNSKPARQTNSLKAIVQFHDRLEKDRDKLAFEIDGIVIKLDSLKIAEKLGTRHRSPRGALAWKFAPREEITVLEDIVVQVGKSGALTPVALLASVDVGGVTISRATLHNEGEVQRKDIRIGDRVRIKRAGDVIPEVVERISSPRRRGKVFSMPQKCPACGTRVVREGANYFCPAGIMCPGQLGCCLTHFASREAMDIEGLGDETARLLIEHNLVKDVSDLFRLKVEDLQSLPGFAAASGRKQYQAIRTSMHPRLDRFLYALAIRHVGQRTARRLAQEFGSLSRVREANEEQVAHVAGPVVGRSVRQFFGNTTNKRVLKQLEKSGVIVEDMPALKSHAVLSGKTFVFTGTLSDFTRAKAKEVVETRGGRVMSSVSRNTDYVVAGVNPGSKFTDAKELGIKIIDESAFGKLLRAMT